MKYLIYKNIPNIISITRVLPIPIVYIFFIPNKFNIIIAIFWIGISDFLDGYLSRLFKLSSNTGKSLDPICDKISILLIYYIMVVYFNAPLYYLVIILVKDLTLILGVILIYILNNYFKYSITWNVTKISKYNTAFIIFTMLYNIIYDSSIIYLTSSIICILTLLEYIIMFAKKILNLKYEI